MMPVSTYSAVGSRFLCRSAERKCFGRHDVPLFRGWPENADFVLQVRYEIMFELFKQRSVWFHLTVSLVLNWIVGPLLMTGLAWATLPDLDHYRNGNHPYKGYLNNLEWMSGSLI